jgi:hypothetical protein
MTEPQSPPTLDRRTLAALADVLIPAADGMPAASEAGAAGEWLDEVLRVRGDLEAPLHSLLDRARGVDPAAEVERLEHEEPDAFEALATAVAGAYFLNPDVRTLIGYPGQERRPIEPEDPPDYEQDGLLASVVERGPIFRRTPESRRPAGPS